MGSCTGLRNTTRFVLFDAVNKALKGCGSDSPRHRACFGGPDAGGFVVFDA